MADLSNLTVEPQGVILDTTPKPSYVPLGPYVLIQLDALKKVSPGGLHLPDSKEGPPYWTGTIVSKGDEAKGGPQVGNRVVWRTPPMCEFMDVGQVVVPIEELLAVVK